MTARYSGTTFLLLAGWIFQLAPHRASAEPARTPDPTPPQLATPSNPTVEPWPLAIEIGGGVSRGPQATFEGTFSPDLVGPHISIGYSRGARGSVVYGEAAVNLLITLGIGLDHHTDPSAASRWGAHALVGLPIPIVRFGRDGATTPLGGQALFRVAPLLVYCEPFYRPHIRSGAAANHEVGVALKVRVGLTRKQWSLPGYSLFDGVTDL